MASSNAGTNDEFVEGIVQGHAYTIISAVTLDAHGRKWNLLKIRNPWGQGEWTGDWSDDSDLWTPELSAELGQTDGNDGIFFITVEDYL